MALIDGMLLDTRREWWCPNCTVTAVTHDVTLTKSGAVRTQYHECRGLGGVSAPMLERNERAHVYAVVREDYVGKEKGLRYDAKGRPIMAVHKVTDDTDSCTVFPGVAFARLTPEVREELGV